MAHKNHIRNLENFRQAVESPKSWNSMDYICQKNTFLQLKNYRQRIYLTLLSTTVKNSPNPWFHFWNHKSFFMTHTTCLCFCSSNITYFWQKHAIRVRIFRFFIARVKIHQIMSFFKQKVSFSSKFWPPFSVMRDNPSAPF